MEIRGNVKVDTRGFGQHYCYDHPIRGFQVYIFKDEKDRKTKIQLSCREDDCKSFIEIIIEDEVFGVLEDLREYFSNENMTAERDSVNHLHYLLQEYREDMEKVNKK